MTEERSQAETRNAFNSIERLFQTGIFDEEGFASDLKIAAVTYLLIHLRDLIAKAEALGFVPAGVDNWDEVTQAIIDCRDAACHVDSGKARRSPSAGPTRNNIFVGENDLVFNFGDYFVSAQWVCFPAYHYLKPLHPEFATEGFARTFLKYRPAGWPYD